MQWRCMHPRELPRETWHDWLARAPHHSPCLLPEWGLFWQHVWPDSRAELWVLSDSADTPIAAVPMVRRARAGLQMCYAQPFGTPSGPLGAAAACDPSSLRMLTEAACNWKVVEFAAVPDWCGPHLRGWTGSSTEHTAWVIDRRQGDGIMENRFSTSHRRNIGKADAAGLQIVAPQTSCDVAAWRDAWSAPIDNARIALNRVCGPRLFDTFEHSDALIWRTALYEKRPVAMAVFLVHNRAAVYIDGAVDRAAAPTGSHHYLFAHVLHELSERQIDLIDLGSGPGGTNDPGLAQFKRGWGAQPQSRRAGFYRRGWYHKLRQIVR